MYNEIPQKVLIDISELAHLDRIIANNTKLIKMFGDLTIDDICEYELSMTNNEYNMTIMGYNNRYFMLETILVDYDNWGDEDAMFEIDKILYTIHSVVNSKLKHAVKEFKDYYMFNRWITRKSNRMIAEFVFKENVL